ncbi:MAG TPA: hypothetical protein VGM11_01800 [Acidobacteriaceae bacterium]|jgi:membrane-bound ClpP family serine protease
MLPLFNDLTPNAAILLLTLGIALIAVELNRPGWITPGAVGLLLTLLAAASLRQHHPRSAPAILAVASMAFLFLQARRPMTWIIPACLSVVLVLALTALLPRSAQPGISPFIALLCGVTLAAGTTVLTRIARRARQNKGLD